MRGITETSGGSARQVIYDSANDLTWNIDIQDTNVTITTTYPVTINAFSNNGANATGQVSSTETFDFTPFKNAILKFKSQQVNAQAGYVENGRFRLQLAGTTIVTNLPVRAEVEFQEIVDISAINTTGTVLLACNSDENAALDTTNDYILREIILIGNDLL